jgi:hypothetical protein
MPVDDRPTPLAEAAPAAEAPQAKPAYAAPEVNTYSDAALLEALGPAQAGGTYTVFGGP